MVAFGAYTAAVVACRKSLPMAVMVSEFALEFPKQYKPLLYVPVALFPIAEMLCAVELLPHARIASDEAADISIRQLLTRQLFDTLKYIPWLAVIPETMQFDTAILLALCAVRKLFVHTPTQFDTAMFFDVLFISTPTVQF